MSGFRQREVYLYWLPNHLFPLGLPVGGSVTRIRSVRASALLVLRNAHVATADAPICTGVAESGDPQFSR